MAPNHHATILASGTCCLKNERYYDLSPGRLRLGVVYVFERVVSAQAGCQHWIRLRNELGKTIPVTKREFERFFQILTETRYEYLAKERGPAQARASAGEPDAQSAANPEVGAG